MKSLATCGAVGQQRMYWRRLAKQVWQEGVRYIHLYTMYSLFSSLHISKVHVVHMMQEM